MKAKRPVIVAALTAAILSSAGAAAPAKVSSATPGSGAILRVSRCGGQNAEVVQAVDGRYVYEVWIGCGGIGFARSTNGGRSFGRTLTMPESKGKGFNPPSGGNLGLPKFGWDPAIAVAPNRTVYVSYMVYRHGYAHPVVAASTNQGASFPRVANVLPPRRHNWGDRDYLAVASDGTVYLTWDYGVSLNTRLGNIVIQRSSDGGRTWSHIQPVTPGFPSHGGGVAGYLLVEPRGRIDLLFWILQGGVPKPVLPGGYIYFTGSADRGRSWSRPLRVQPAAGRIGVFVGWIDDNLGMDSAGNLYATWDTQSPGGDIGWLSYSTDHGRSWARAQRATTDHDNAEHIMGVVGGRPGVAYVGWLADNARQGFAQYLRSFSIKAGWRCAPRQVSQAFGNRNVWPGDTIGISVLPKQLRGSTAVMLSWGSAVSHRTSQFWATSVPAC